MGDFDEMRRLIGQEVLLLANTYIGGVGAAFITSPADFVSKTTGLTVANITNFQIDGSNNVSFFVDAAYQMTSAWVTVASLTYFIDLSAFANQIYLLNCDNCKYIYAPNMTSIGGTNGYFGNSDNVLKSNFNPINLNHRFIYADAKKIKKLDLSRVVQANPAAGDVGMYNLILLERLYLANLSTVNSAVTDSSRLYRNIFLLQGIKTGCKIYYHSAMGVTDRNAFAKILGQTQVGDKIYINGLTYTSVAGAPAAAGEFTNSASFLNLANAINSDARVGTYSDITAITSGTSLTAVVTAIGVAGNSVTISLDGANTGTTVIVNSFKGGNDVHPFLIYARDVRSCTLVQCSAPIAVNAPAGLSYSDKTVNTVKLNFTVPAPNANGTDVYEVWVDDGTLWRKLFEFAEIATSGSTLNLAEVVTDVGTINGSKIKIRTMDGQMNFSDFSNEITIL